MTREELIRSIRESSKAVRNVAARRDVGREAEEALRLIAAGLDELAMASRDITVPPLAGI